MTENKSILPYQTSPFDAIRQINKQGEEFWSARDLQPLLGYETWEKFEDCIDRGMVACQNSGYKISDQFRDAAKMIEAGKGAKRSIGDYHLSRFACYLTAMNGDPRKPEIAAAQTYFAIKTREAETARQGVAPAQLSFDFHFIVECRSIDDVERTEQALAYLKKAHALLTGQSGQTAVDVPTKPTQPKQKRIAAQKNPEDEILRVVKKLEDQDKPPTLRDLGRYLTRIEVENLKMAVAECMKKRAIIEEKTAHAVKYRLA